MSLLIFDILKIAKYRNQESQSTTQPNLSWEWLLIGWSTHSQNSWGTDADFVINMKWGGVVSNLEMYLTATFACRWSERKIIFWSKAIIK